MIYVLDQNYLRKDELKNIISTDPTCKFVLPDVAILEMCKSDKWEKTMRGSLEFLSVCPGRVFHSMSVGEAMRYEVDKQHSIEGNLLPREYRTFIRKILCDIACGGSEKAINLISTRIIQAQREIQSDELNHRKNIVNFTELKKSIDSAVKKDFLKALKKNMLDDSVRLEFIRKNSEDQCRYFLASCGFNQNKITTFMKSKPLILRFSYLAVRHSLDWAIKGGIDCAKPETITNDLLDQEYVLIASFFDGILSKEKRVVEADRDLRLLLKST